MTLTVGRVFYLIIKLNKKKKKILRYLHTVVQITGEYLKIELIYRKSRRDVFLIIFIYLLLYIYFPPNTRTAEQLDAISRISHR